MKLVIGNKNYSSWSLRPWLAMKHLGLDFEEVRIALDQPDTVEKIAAYNPAGLVPVLIDGHLVVWESMAIMEHLADRHPKFWPADERARVTARSVSMEMHAGFAALRHEMPMNIRASARHVTPSPAAERDIERITTIWREARTAWQDEGPWLFGAFSIADAMFAPVAARFRTYGVAVDGMAASYPETLFRAPAMQEWCTAAAVETEIIERDETGRQEYGSPHD